MRQNILQSTALFAVTAYAVQLEADEDLSSMMSASLGDLSSTSMSSLALSFDQSIEMLTGTFQCEDVKYYLSEDRKSFYDAEIECQNMGGHLASFANVKEQKQVRKMISGVADEWYIGFKKEAGSAEYLWNDHTDNFFNHFLKRDMKKI